MMTGQAASYESGTALSTYSGEAAPAFTATTPATAHHIESAEQEITRLTWSVLDGSASLADRQRLAALVNAQHAVRRRFDR